MYALKAVFSQAGRLLHEWLTIMLVLLGEGTSFPYHDEDDLQFDADKGYEVCILCWRETDIPRHLYTSDPRRLSRYIDGCGQVCRDCPIPPEVVFADEGISMQDSPMSVAVSGPPEVAVYQKYRGPFGDVLIFWN